MVGLDVMLGKTNWLLTTSVRYLDMNTNIDLDPMVFQIGLGYTF